MPVGNQPVAVLRRHLVLPGLDLRGQELVYPPALDAHQVVVVLPRQLRLEAGQPVLQVDGGGDPGLAEQPQRPVHRGAPHRRVRRPHLGMQVVGGDMPAHAEEALQDEFPLPRLLESVLLGERPQPFERLLPGGPGRRRRGGGRLRRHGERRRRAPSDTIRSRRDRRAPGIIPAEPAADPGASDSFPRPWPPPPAPDDPKCGRRTEPGGA